MKKRAFIDAQGWVALKNENDQHFEKAHQILQSLAVERAQVELLSQ